jgi:hypothetical protein
MGIFMKKSLFVLFSLLLANSLISTASAHQPRIVYKQQILQTNPVIVRNPEISQAYYAELKGQPEYYTIISDKEFNLYVQILSPKIIDSKKDFSAEVIKDANVLAVLNGSTYKWTEFYEPFVGDSYWMGPEFKKHQPQGEYQVKVYNSDNRGKYVLVVGQAEAFPLNETLKMFVTLPQLKHYFGKPSYTAFLNLVGLFWLIQLIILVLTICGLVWIVRKVRRKVGRALYTK